MRTSTTPAYPANLSQANFTNAICGGMHIHRIELHGCQPHERIILIRHPDGRDFTGAEVRGANFTRDTSHGAGTGGTGISPAQLASTASYQAHDLSGIVLGVNNLSGANLTGQKLTNASFYWATLTGANLSQANLTNANFTYATLTGANLTGADVRGRISIMSTWRGPEGLGTGISLTQLYTTASYQSHDMSVIKLVGHHLDGANLAGQNLTNADLSFATLTNANINQANLTNAKFVATMLTGASFTNAEVRGADFCGSNLSTAQLYSTASYHAQDLTGIGLNVNTLAGVKLASQNLTNASVYGPLTNANFLQANLTGATIGGTLTAQLQRREVRGAPYPESTRPNSTPRAVIRPTI